MRVPAAVLFDGVCRANLQVYCSSVVPLNAYQQCLRVMSHCERMLEWQYYWASHFARLPKCNDMASSKDQLP